MEVFKKTAIEWILSSLEAEQQSMFVVTILCSGPKLLNPDFSSPSVASGDFVGTPTGSMLC